MRDWTVPETLAQGEAGGDGQPHRALLQGEGQQGGEDEDPDQVELELGPRPGAGDDGAGAHRAGRQHGPVEERGEGLHMSGQPGHCSETAGLTSHVTTNCEPSIELSLSRALYCPFRLI